ncbi:MAG: 4-hydroxy-3-methylbut-2-enyl diphosphate reductase [Alphaproteobacteria bacterium]|nr:4-hydroxy-3-methylbut-2-enyl diphosphate reductase [Rickettsiales bacterium]
MSVINKTNNNKIEVFLADPRGFCAGVNRAIDCLDIALKKFGTPLYVRHAIVHNKTVVADFISKGVVFVEDIKDIPIGSNIVLSAHGASVSVVNEAKNRDLNIIDATCPLVKSVHNIARELEQIGCSIILIGHKKHQEVIGTVGQVNCDIVIVEELADVSKIELKDINKVGYITQTTLNIDDAKNIIDALKIRFPNIIGPKDGNICYATKNRQDIAVQVAQQVDIVLILGSINSSNSNHLKDICGTFVKSYLIDSYKDIKDEWFIGVCKIGISAGASVPEFLMTEVLIYLNKYFSGTVVHTVKGADEEISFLLPSSLLD